MFLTLYWPSPNLMGALQGINFDLYVIEFWVPQSNTLLRIIPELLRAAEMVKLKILTRIGGLGGCWQNVLGKALT